MNINQAIGCFVGLAVGDALGATLEFGPRLEPGTHTEMIGKGPHRLKPGEYTDDTAMAIALAHSIWNCGRFDAFDTAMEFTRWYTRGIHASNGRCFDIGNTTRQGLERFIAKKTPVAEFNQEALGNGALMRLAPVPISLWKNPSMAATVAAQQCRITHNSDLNAAACAWLAFKLARQFECPTSLFHDVGPLVPHDMQTPPALEACVTGNWAEVDRSLVISDGHVINTLGAALWSIQTTRTFSEAVIAAVNLGDDADTVGAVTGMIAGAIYGLDAIPASWLSKLVGRREIEGLARKLV